MKLKRGLYARMNCEQIWTKRGANKKVKTKERYVQTNSVKVVERLNASIPQDVFTNLTFAMTMIIAQMTMKITTRKKKRCAQKNFYDDCANGDENEKMCT